MGQQRKYKILWTEDALHVQACQNKCTKTQVKKVIPTETLVTRLKVIYVYAIITWLQQNSAIVCIPSTCSSGTSTLF